MKRIHAYISGRVQGVNFRWNTKLMADKLGIKGWVKNLPDGRVEIVAEGDDERIDVCLEYVKKGPLLAKVEKIELKEEVYKNEFKKFLII
ncbi:MAG: acylphosphatase [Candidatus Aenigmatarchaeota archaeon]